MVDYVCYLIDDSYVVVSVEICGSNYKGVDYVNYCCVRFCGVGMWWGVVC